MKVGFATASVSRRAGGLFCAVRSLAYGIQQVGCDVKVFSVIDEFSREDASQWQGLDCQLLSRFGPKAFSYAPDYAKTLDMNRLDLIHSHGLWMYPTLAAWWWSKRWKRPLIVSPHGMLDPWAVSNSAWKKQLVGMLFEHAHLRHCTCLHALCESEYRAFRRYGLSNPVAIIPNGADLSLPRGAQLQPDWAIGLSPDSRVLLFLGRIHPKKGLLNLLQAWAAAWQHMPAIAQTWHLVIAGWDQESHQAQLVALAENLGVMENVHFVGPQFDEQKTATLVRANAFILPSFSEGLPMAVLEAWSYRLPVLMTVQCNLPEGFESQAALVMVPEIGSIGDALESLFNMSEDARLAMGERGRMLVQKRFAWPTIAAQMCEVYAWMLGESSPPECVIMD
jgi:poly(glycerol-phosphate) alpha-glucosyltransferase